MPPRLTRRPDDLNVPGRGWRPLKSDSSDELDGEVFGALRDLILFATSYQHPIMGTVAWANGTNMAPEFRVVLVLVSGQQGA